MLYIDTCTYDDYDKAILFCIKNNINVNNRNKAKMSFAAEMSEDDFARMQKEAGFKESIIAGDTPLD